MKVKVGPHTYRVRFDQSAIDKIAANEMDGRVGECDTEKLTILVKPDMELSVRQDTLLHEVLHAVTEMTGLCSELGRETDEKVVRVMAPVLVQVLQDNPKFVKYLLDG